MPDISIPITRDKLEEKRNLLYASKGIKIEGDAATINHDGIQVAFIYDGETLSADLVKVPFKYKMFKGKIKQEITDWFTKESA